ncbi:hypothetical protein [Streptomyces cucumeris]|uniref:hypothetical protein n=1 Tax=Streptomyces cucumeris TaxID=2962890 RepID=UPI0020C9298C|nr:hypothetical protein [Streptomyces sp. NEAU-Y11]MCP9205537.1 hypothetical protein [Streptomyces sp. NEAU-Y11]
MNPIPPAALAVMTAAAEDYRLLTPPDQATPAGLVDHVAEYLVSSGYRIYDDIPLPARAWHAIRRRIRFPSRTRAPGPTPAHTNGG